MFIQYTIDSHMYKTISFSHTLTGYYEAKAILNSILHSLKYYCKNVHLIALLHEQSYRADIDAIIFERVQYGVQYDFSS